jgi:hypothetical protein
MGDNQKRILQMLAEGKLTVDEANRLLAALNEEPGGETQGAEKPTKPKPKYLYVKVEPKEGHPHGEHGRVNVRVPVSLVRAGMKLSALMPPQVAEDVNRSIKGKGINFDIRNLKDEDIEHLISALAETEIDVDSDEATVHIYAG